MNVEFYEAPCRVTFGYGMVMANIEIDKDHTLTMYCEEDQIDKLKEVFCKLAKEEVVVERI